MMSTKLHMRNMAIRQRIKTVLKTAGLALLFALTCFLSMRFHIPVPCAFKLITGLDCPSCGVTRMGIAMMHGDLPLAFRYNQLLTILSPFFAIYILFFTLRYLKSGQAKTGKVENIILIIIIAMLLIYGVIRNLPFYPYPLR